MVQTAARWLLFGILCWSPATTLAAKCGSIATELIPLYNARPATGKPYTARQSPLIQGLGTWVTSCSDDGWDYVVAGQSGCAPTSWLSVVHTSRYHDPCSVWIDIGPNAAPLQPLDKGWRVLVFNPDTVALDTLRLDLFLNAHSERKAGLVPGLVCTGGQCGVAEQKLELHEYIDEAGLQQDVGVVRVWTTDMNVLRAVAGVLKSSPSVSLLMHVGAQHGSGLFAKLFGSPDSLLADHASLQAAISYLASLQYAPFCSVQGHDNVPTQLVPQDLSELPACTDIVFQRAKGAVATPNRPRQPKSAPKPKTAPKRQAPQQQPAKSNTKQNTKPALVSGASGGRTVSHAREMPDFKPEKDPGLKHGDLQPVGTPAAGCPKPFQLDFLNGRNLGNAVMIWLDSVASVLFHGCSAYIKLTNMHPDIQTLKLPAYVAFSPRGYCVNKVCLDCLTEPCMGPSTHYLWVPNMENSITLNAAVWNSPQSERLHAMTPLVKRVITPQLLKTNDNEPIVIHFRCSDSPMNLHWGYHFLKYSYYEQALQKLIPKDAKLDVLVLSCGTHNVHQGDNSRKHWPDLCQKYTTSFVTWLKKRGHRVRVDCGKSVVADLSRMANAKYLISGGCTSSLSYVAMLASNNTAVFPSMVAEDDIPGKEGDTLLKVVAKPSMANHNYKMRPGLYVLDSTKSRLYHKDVAYQYEDVDLVEKLLHT